MPVETRKDKASAGSLVEKTAQFSPRVHASLSTPLARHGANPTALGSPELADPVSRFASMSTSRPSEQDYASMMALLQEVNVSLQQHKQYMAGEMSTLQASQQQFQTYIEKQFKEISENLKKHMNEEIKKIETYVDSEVGRVCERMNDMETKLNNVKDHETPEYDPEVSIIMSKVPKVADENIQLIAEKIIHEHLDLPGIPIVRAMRLPQRQQQRDGPAAANRDPPLVKVQLRSVDDKKSVLRVKKRVGTSRDYGTVWIRSSKPHAERIMDFNCRTILKLLGPQADNMIVNNSGRIVKKLDQNPENNN